MKVAFVTDSGTGYSKEYWKEKGIYSLPLQIEYDGNSYDEEETITKEQVVQNLKDKKVMKTSLPKLGYIQDLFEQLKKDGYDTVFAVPICKGLSGTMDAMEMIANQEGLSFIGFNCYSTAVLQAFCIETAKKMYDEGKSIDDILAHLEKVSKGADTILLVDDLQNMKRGGRLTPMAAALGGLLRIKPVLHINDETEGKVDVLAKVRTASKAQEYVINRLVDERGVNKDWDITVAHEGAPEAAKAYAEKIESKIDGAKVNIIDLISTVGTHTGLGCLAVQAFDPKA